MYGGGLAVYLKFTLWFIPIAGALALWKLVEIIWWLFQHVRIS